MVCGCLGRVGYNLVWNIRQGGDAKSSGSKLRVGDTSCLLPRCRGCSHCSALVTHWSPSSSGVFKHHLLVRLWGQELLIPEKKPTLSMILIQMWASLTGKSSIDIQVLKDVERKTFVKDYPQGRMASRGEGGTAEMKKSCLEGSLGFSWVLYTPAQGCQCSKNSCLSFSGLGDLFPLALGKALRGLAGRELP